MRIDCVTVGPLSTNCYIVSPDDGDEAVIIDPGAGAKRILAALGDRKIAAVLLTHGHFDHTGALRAFAQAPIYMHPADEIMLSDSAWSAGDMVRDAAPRPPVTNFVMEGAKLCLAGLEIGVMHVPGHTKGSVAYCIGDSLFTGDTMFRRGYGRCDFPGGSEAEERRSLRRLLRLEKNYAVYPGHGEATTLNAEREFYL